MASSDPARLTRLVAEALARVGARAVLARGWSGAAATDLPDTIFAVDKVPHHWLFPRMAALVHHGGAGTTAAGLRAGKPALIVPHMADQPYWGRRVFELGVGVRPLPRPRLTAEALARRLEALLADTHIAANAAALGEHIRAEQGVANAVEWIGRFVKG
jgi:sterol 3beta-glucosyltransferase